jgi:hypothetical protein
MIRHRWWGDPLLELWRCTRGVPPMWSSPDPLCPGCDVEVRWAAVPQRDRWHDLANRPIAAEDLVVRLDLVVVELQAAEACR